ncbi:hypothetical protein QR680_014036 [Steinernema hermaphroditum]|uniref:Uncharacterized protein n=1 Tax=Steinernema hermaphroditum TaxID=289476 RepID=A0AA39I7H7_9BILA|nr:hypothetical protein QR680_014036 [Steinernema hermaphroditum]
MAADVLPSGWRFSSTQMPAETIKQLMKHHSTAAPKTKQLLENECDVILECRICLALFRRTADFITHKENYCQSSQNAVTNLASIREPGDGSEEADLSKQLMHSTPKIQKKVVSFDTSGARVEERRASVKIKNQIPPDRLPATIPTNRNVLYKRELRSAVKRALTLPNTAPTPQPKKKAVEKKPEKAVPIGTTRFTPARLQEKREEPKQKVKEEKQTPMEVVKMEKSVNRAVNTASPVRVKNNIDNDKLEFDPDQYPTEVEEQTYQRVYQHVRSLVDLEALRCVEPECDDFSNFQSIESLAYHLIVRHTKKCFFFQYHPCLLCNRKLRSLKSVWEHVANRHNSVYQRHKETSDPNVVFPSMEFPDGFVPQSIKHASDDEEDAATVAEQPKPKKQQETVEYLMEKCFSLTFAYWKSFRENAREFSLDKFNIRPEGMPPLQKVESVAPEEFSDEEQEDSPPVLSVATGSDETDSQDSAPKMKEDLPRLEYNAGETMNNEEQDRESDISVDILNVSDEIVVTAEEEEEAEVRSEAVDILEEEDKEEEVDKQEAKNEEEEVDVGVDKREAEGDVEEEQEEEHQDSDAVVEEDYPVLEKVVEDEHEEEGVQEEPVATQEPEVFSAVAEIEATTDSNSNSEGPPALSPQSSVSRFFTEEDRQTIILERIYTEDVCPPEGFEQNVNMMLARKAQELAETMRENERKKRERAIRDAEGRASESIEQEKSPLLNAGSSSSSSITSPPDAPLVLGKRERKLPKRFEEHSLPSILTKDREHRESERAESSKSEPEKSLLAPVPHVQESSLPPLDRMATPERRSPSSEQGRGSRIRRPSYWISSNDYVK